MKTSEHKKIIKLPLLRVKWPKTTKIEFILSSPFLVLMTNIQLKTQQAATELPARRNVILIIPPWNQQLRKADKYRMVNVFKHWLLLSEQTKPKKISDIVVSGH